MGLLVNSTHQNVAEIGDNYYFCELLDANFAVSEALTAESGFFCLNNQETRIRMTSKA